jgi:hypothetical protein
MVTTTRNQKNARHASPKTKKIQKEAERVSQQHAFSDLLLRRNLSGGELEYGAFQEIATEYQSKGFSAVTVRNLRYHLALFLETGSLGMVSEKKPPSKQIRPTHMSDISPLTDDEEQDEESSVEGSHVVDNNHPLLHNNRDSEKPKAVRLTKEMKKQKHLLAVQEATVRAASNFQTVRTKSTCKVPPGTLQEIIAGAEKEFDLPAGTVKKQTVLSRVKRNNVTGVAHQRVSPLIEMEPLIVEWCEGMAKLGMALNRENVVELATDLIQETETAAKLVDFKEKRKLEAKVGEKVVIGTSWYKAFMKRNKDLLKRARCKVKDQKRRTWCTYERFASMYDGVYEAMVEAKVAVKLKEEIMYDINGEQTTDKTKMYGRPTTYHMVDPANVLFVDETGCNTNMKQDGHVGGELFVLPCEKGSEFGVCGATTDMHFTVLCFTNGLGVPVMCAVLMKSTKEISEIPLSWRLGIDIRKQAETGETRVDIFNANFGEGKVMPGGPVCTYNGVEMPCFIGSSPNASITSELLAAMLETMDQRNLFDRTDGKRPFLLLDGHQSRVRLPFLRYINDEAHPWMVCLGVPYGTHLWQVGDSSEQNGSFKMALYRAKKEYLTYRDIDDQKFVVTDIIPLINTAWAKSFAKVDSSRKAILRRGWNPLNYVLLDHPELNKPNQTDSTTTGTDSTTTGTVGATITSDEAAQTTATHTTAITTLNASLQVNKNGKTVSNYLTNLLAQESKDEGRKRKYEQQQREKQENGKRIDVLKDMTKVTAGKLVGNGCHVLGKDLLQKVQEKEDQEQQKKNAVKRRKNNQQDKERDAFRESYHKYVNNQRLTNNDLRNLLRNVRKRDDSPIRTKKAELHQQWLKRKERLDIYQLTPSNMSNNGISGDPVEILPTPINFPVGRDIGSGNDFLVMFAENGNPTVDRTSTVGEI